MLSIKKTSKVIVIILISLVFLSVVFNLWIVREVKSDIRDTKFLVLKLGEANIEYSLPLRVVRNILGMHLENDGIISETALEAYKVNNQVNTEINENINKYVTELEKIAVDSKVRWFSKYDELYQSILDNLGEVREINSQLNGFIQLSMDDKQDSQVNYVNIAEIDQRNAIKDIQQEFDTMADILFNDIFLIINASLLIMILIILFVIAMNLRYQHYQDKFIASSFESLENHEFSFEKLKRVRTYFSEEKYIYETVKNFFYEQNISVEARKIMVNSYDVDKVLNQLFHIYKGIIDINRIGIAFVDYEAGIIFTEGAISDYNDILLDIGYSVKINESSLKPIIVNKKGVINNNLLDGKEIGHLSETKKLITQEGIKSNMVIPLISNEEVFGLIFFSSNKVNHFNADHLRISEKIIYELSEILKRSYLIKVVFNRFTKSIAELVDNRDNETGDHLERMTQYSVVIAKGLLNSPLDEYKVDLKYVEDIKTYAASHDIGKVGISDYILKKPGRLTYDEFEIMKKHTIIGENVFKEIRSSLKMFDDSYFKISEEIVGAHHEKWDGSGYPHGLKGSEIPLSARIVAIADVFDALTSKRVYKEAFSIEAALAIIEEGKGQHFDPYLVDVFFEKLDKIKEIFYSQYSNFK